MILLKSQGRMVAVSNQKVAEELREWTVPWGATGGTVSDKAARYTHCVIDNGNGTLTTTMAQPNGRRIIRRVTGKIPDGDIRVEFADQTLQYRWSGPKLIRSVHMALGQHPNLHW